MLLPPLSLEADTASKFTSTRIFRAMPASTVALTSGSSRLSNRGLRPTMVTSEPIAARKWPNSAAM